MEWRYLPRGEVKHALERASDVGAVCGIRVWHSSDWWGTGSQAEYERLDELPECRRCVTLLGRRAPRR